MVAALLVVQPMASRFRPPFLSRPVVLGMGWGQLQVMREVKSLSWEPRITEDHREIIKYMGKFIHWMQQNQSEPSWIRMLVSHVSLHPNAGEFRIILDDPEVGIAKVATSRSSVAFVHAKKEPSAHVKSGCTPFGSEKTCSASGMTRAPDFQCGGGQKTTIGCSRGKRRACDLRSTLPFYT